jgi:hypothetical protein
VALQLFSLYVAALQIPEVEQRIAAGTSHLLTVGVEADALDRVIVALQASVQHWQLRVFWIGHFSSRC